MAVRNRGTTTLERLPANAANPNPKPFVEIWKVELLSSPNHVFGGGLTCGFGPRALLYSEKFITTKKVLAKLIAIDAIIN